MSLSLPSDPVRQIFTESTRMGCQKRRHPRGGSCSDSSCLSRAKHTFERRASQSPHFSVLKDYFGLMTGWCHDHVYLVVSRGTTIYYHAYQRGCLKIES